MSIYAVAGEIGSGKSLFQLKFALQMANEKEKQLVFNFPVNRPAIKKYAEHMGYKWILRLLEYGGISEFHAPKNLQVLMKYNSVVCIDEAGVLLNSRCWKDTPKAFLADLCQSRKMATDLIWAAQFAEQVDSQMRMLTQYWIQASGLTYYDKPSKLPRLYYKRYYFMSASQFNRYSVKPVSHIKTRLFFSYRYEGGFLGTADALLFDCFDTSLLLDKRKGISHADENLDYCRLCDRPKNYRSHYQHTFPSRAALHLDSDNYCSGILAEKLKVGMLSRESPQHTKWFYDVEDNNIFDSSEYISCDDFDVITAQLEAVEQYA